ncbi:hypothetical protein CC78DRAFT_535606 [Lojkania enalia]|uniref:LysM domain-containing protein n=1 Tax=Lojkania enalia TaxID=147567 RepID=A0A9P4N453_9PLEO|nr:hypothetical protein CC78DRAFT_535606 [Didymosphaeria enalia]
MNPTNAPTSSKSSSTLATSSLRPRVRRLISVDDEVDATSGSEAGQTPAGSRTASPIPRSRTPRSTATSNPSSSFRSLSVQPPKITRDTSAAFSGLLGNSWSAIQGLATNVLGNDFAPKDTLTSRRKPALSAHRRTSSSAPPKQWGPPASSISNIGAGSQEERESMVRTMKRKDLLTASEHLVPDSVGRVKRRSSDERLSASAPPGENDDRDALVYIHNVQPQDTLAGISIKFNCQPAILRKVNRMWPNDTVQSKDTIILPVDACGVKGRPVSGPHAHPEDLLLGEYGDSANGTSTDSSLVNGRGAHKDKAIESTLESSASQSITEHEQPWKHDSWVLLPNNTNPTEIGRIPRRSLGFFPPARRKSLAFSDASTPSPSIDLPRSSTSTTPLTSSPNARPSTSRELFSRPQGRHRSLSNFSLHGPGGVGTMGKNVRSPGPAQDGLNKLFASHLPNVAPPPGQEYFTPWAPSLLDPDTGTTVQYGGSGARTPIGSTGIDFQEVGGAIEGWMRKVASQASKMLTEPSTPGQGKRSAVPIIGAVGGDLGDLIELRDDAFETGGDEGDRGRSGRDDSLISISEQDQSARSDINLVVRDRGKKGEGSKTD